MTDSGGKTHSIVEKVFTKSAVTFILNTTVWVTLADGMVIGNFLGADAVAAYGLAWPIVLLFGLVTAVLSGGTRTLYSQVTGQGETGQANKTFTVAVGAGTVISAAIIIGT